MASYSKHLRNPLFLLVSLQMFSTSLLAQNLTLTFSPSNADSCASLTNASSVGGLALTTSSTPCAALCMNLADIFHGESTGIVNNTRGVSCPNEVSNITYTVSNQENFDPTANYSRIFYQQTLAAGPVLSTQEIVEDQAFRFVSFWSGVDCEAGINEDGEVGERVEPYYVQDCVSGVDGQCNTAAVGVKSFLIGNTVNAYEEPREGTCRSFAYEGDGGRLELWRAGAIWVCLVATIAALL